MGSWPSSGVVDADDSGLVNVGVRDQSVLDLDGVDVLAAPQDQVAGAGSPGTAGRR